MKLTQGSFATMAWWNWNGTGLISPIFWCKALTLKDPIVQKDSKVISVFCALHVKAACKTLAKFTRGFCTGKKLFRTFSVADIIRPSQSFHIRLKRRRIKEDNLFLHSNLNCLMAFTRLLIKCSCSLLNFFFKCVWKVLKLNCIS